MIVKGCQKRLIMVPTRGSALFESAYFILRKETELRAPSHDEMLCEATRILKEHTATEKTRTLGRKHLLIAFGIGLVLGALSVGLLLTALL